MKYYNWIEPINYETFQKFIDFINGNQGEEITVHFSSIGGDQNVASAVVEVINKNVKCVIVVGGVYSSGFYILKKIKCKLVLTKGVMGMFHYSIRNNFAISVRNSQATYSEDINAVRNNKFYKKQCEKLAKEVMKKKELKLFKKDKDVYFPFNRMKEIFPNAEVI